MNYNDGGPHATGHVRCTICGREWVGVWPVGDVAPLHLECPWCGWRVPTPDANTAIDDRDGDPRGEQWAADHAGPVSLAAVRIRPHPDVVAVCRDLLRRAEAGEIRGIAYACSCDGRAEGSAYELGDGGVAALHLSLVRLQGRLLDEGCT